MNAAIPGNLLILAADKDRPSPIFRAQAIQLGWLWKHESGTYVKFTEAGADLFA